MSDLSPSGKTKESASKVEVVPGSKVKSYSTPTLSSVTLPAKILRSLSQMGTSIQGLEDKTPLGGRIYFPQELTGGVCTRVVGEEEYIVWRAAAAACGSERIHVVWQSVGDKVYYLAIKSEEIAAHPNTWCPFAALLPGMKSATAFPVCYTYHANGSTTMMTVTANEIQIYRGISLIARAIVERTARELNNASIIDLTPDKLAQLKPRPWVSLSLVEDQARRLLMMALILASLPVTGLAFLIWIYAGFSILSSNVTMAHVAVGGSDHTQEFLKSYYDLRDNPLQHELNNFIKINDELLAADGLLLTYQINHDETFWRASVRRSISPEIMSNMNAVQFQPAGSDNVIIGHGKTTVLREAGEQQ